MRETADVVVIGGGIIGCAIAYEFARAGRSVVVLERGRIGGEASSASGGILVPLHDAEEGGRTPQYDLDRASQLLFPDLVSDLEGATGMDLQFERTGSLRVARSEDEAELLREQFEGWRSELDIGVEWVDEKGTREMEPHLGPEVQSSVYCAEEWSISSTRMVRALARAADQLGAVFREDMPVIGARCSGGGCKALLTPEGEVSAGEFVIAAGAWSRVPLRLVRRGGAHLARARPDGRCAVSRAVAQAHHLVLIRGNQPETERSGMGRLNGRARRLSEAEHPRRAAPDPGPHGGTRAGGRDCRHGANLVRSPALLRGRPPRHRSAARRRWSDHRLGPLQDGHQSGRR